MFQKLTLGGTRWQANLLKLLDIYDDVNFAAILGTLGVTLGYPNKKTKKKRHEFLYKIPISQVPRTSILVGQ